MYKVIVGVLLIASFAGGNATAQGRYGKAKKAASTAPKANNAAAGNNQQPGTTVPPATNSGSRYKRAAAGATGNAPAVDETARTVSAPADTTGLETQYDTTAVGGGVETSFAMPMRDSYVTDKTDSKMTERTPLEYEHLRDDDAIYSHYVWRVINGYEKINKVFMYAGKDEMNRQQNFFSILVNAIINDGVTAFDPENDNFTTPLPSSKVLAATIGNLDTLYQEDPVSGKTYRAVSRKGAIRPDSVYTFRLKEQWVFDKESSRMFVRIIGIAPVAKVKVGAGWVERTLFWVYYPDLRATLAKYQVYNSKNVYGRMTWEEVFESRMFASYIDKSSIDNYDDRRLSAMPGLVGRKLFQLYEGENIKEKIFNYEQSLWAY